MQEFLTVMGMVIASFPQSEYDRRITLLTRECGKITAFVKGAKRQGSRFCGTTDLFAFGNFELYVGKNSYTVQSAEITNFFEYLREDLEASVYAQYFAECIDYYAKEGNDESLTLLLLYRALQALKRENLKNPLVRAIFELKLFFIEGEFIPCDRIGAFLPATLKVIDHIGTCTIEKLYSVTMDENVLEEIKKIAVYERTRLIDRPLKSLEILESMF